MFIVQSEFSLFAHSLKQLHADGLVGSFKFNKCSFDVFQYNWERENKHFSKGVRKLWDKQVAAVSF
jgi:hypothetical protein